MNKIVHDINVFYCCSYIVYTIKDKKRIKLGEYPLGNMNLGLCTGGIYPDPNVRLQYIHSFALSQTYVILPLTSYLLEPCQAMGMYIPCLFMLHTQVSKLIWNLFQWRIQAFESGKYVIATGKSRVTFIWF